MHRLTYSSLELGVGFTMMVLDRVGGTAGVVQRGTVAMVDPDTVMGVRLAVFSRQAGKSVSVSALL